METLDAVRAALAAEYLRERAMHRAKILTASRNPGMRYTRIDQAVTEATLRTYRNALSIALGAPNNQAAAEAYIRKIERRQREMRERLADSTDQS